MHPAAPPDAGVAPSGDVVVEGSAGTTWPVPGCGCVACRSARAPARPAALRVGGLLLAGGGVSDAGGTMHLAAGGRHETGGVRVVALPGPPGPGAPPALVAHVPDVGQVAGTGGGRVTLLWAEGPGRLPEASLDALRGAALDAAALDVRDADGRPDPIVLAHAVARLRAVGALAPGAVVVAIGLGHDLAPAPAAQRLARWGARIVPDGTPLPLRVPPQASAPETPWRTLVLGAAASGKSAVAEDLLAAEPEVLYAATGPAPGPADVAWAERVRAHRGRRPAWWATDETGELARLLRAPGPPLLVDALGTWVAAAMDRAGAWDDAPGWRAEVEGDVDAVVAAWRQARRRVVAVGEEVGWGVVPAEPGVAAFREVLGGLARRLAEQSEQALLVVAGRTVALDPLAAP